MAGKARMPGQIQDNRGGRRAGSGRKPITYLYDNQARDLFREIKARAKKEDRKWQAILMDFVYGRDVDGVTIEMTAKERISAMKLLADMVSSKHSEQNININKPTAPAISLPALQEDPALKVVAGGK